VSALARFLGDSPFKVFVKLLIVSFLVGLVMNAFGWSPWDVYDSVRDFAVDVWNSGFAALGRAGDYILLGAAVVIPVFIILRILSFRRN
jgi:hypothetical protein